MAQRSKRKQSLCQDLTEPEQDRALLPSAKRRSARLGRDPAKSSTLDQSSDSSLFLDLPVELRDWIYTFVAQSAHALLRPESKGKFLDHSPLLRISRQCKDEYTNVLYREAPVVVAEVVDFDFSHIVLFLNKLTPREVASFRTAGCDRNDPRRAFKIRILATPYCAPNPEALHRWLLRCEQPSKKGHDFDFQYAVCAWLDEDNWFHEDGMFDFGVLDVLLDDTDEEDAIERGEMGRVLQELYKLQIATVMGARREPPDWVVWRNGKVVWLRPSETPKSTTRP